MHVDVRRSFKQAALRLHPGKGCDSVVCCERAKRFACMICKFEAMFAHSVGSIFGTPDRDVSDGVVRPLATLYFSLAIFAIMFVQQGVLTTLRGCRSVILAGPVEILRLLVLFIEDGVREPWGHLPAEALAFRAARWLRHTKVRAACLEEHCM